MDCATRAWDCFLILGDLFGLRFGTTKLFSKSLFLSQKQQRSSFFEVQTF